MIISFLCWENLSQAQHYFSSRLLNSLTPATPLSSKFLFEVYRSTALHRLAQPSPGTALVLCTQRIGDPRPLRTRIRHPGDRRFYQEFAPPLTNCEGLRKSNFHTCFICRSDSSNLREVATLLKPRSSLHPTLLGVTSFSNIARGLTQQVLTSSPCRQTCSWLRKSYSLLTNGSARAILKNV